MQLNMPKTNALPVIVAVDDIKKSIKKNPNFVPLINALPQIITNSAIAYENDRHTDLSMIFQLKNNVFAKARVVTQPNLSHQVEIGSIQSLTYENLQMDLFHATLNDQKIFVNNNFSKWSMSLPNAPTQTNKYFYAMPSSIEPSKNVAFPISVSPPNYSYNLLDRSKNSPFLTYSNGEQHYIQFSSPFSTLIPDFHMVSNYLSNCSLDKQTEYAKRTDLDPIMVNWFTQHKSNQLRATVASNQSLRLEQLEPLLNDLDPKVRQSASQNPIFKNAATQRVESFPEPALERAMAPAYT
jgi:hypothetical protein